jgi:ribonuclease HI
VSRTLTMFIDGACKGNPGAAAIGVVIKEDGKTIREISEAIGEATNNIAEYSALICALEQAQKLKASHLKIFTDSELLAKQITGHYQIKNEKLLLLYQQATNLAQGFKQIDVQHIPREENKDADRLASLAIKPKKQTKTVASAFRLTEAGS